VQVVVADGVCKDSAWIQKICEDVMSDVELQTGAKCIGFVMDNTAANRSAEAALGRARPHLVNIGCWSHALSLLIKDFAKRFKWVELAYMRAVEVSNAINNNEKMRSMLHAAMLSSPSKRVFSLSSHCETRFGSRHMVLADVLKAKDVLSQMCSTAEFRDYVSTYQGVSAKRMYETVTDIEPTSLFAMGPVVCELVEFNVVLDMIHQLEGDTPLVSQVLPMIKMLERHVAKFSDKFPNMSIGNDDKLARPMLLEEILERRVREFLYKDCFAAAFLPDPMHWVKNASDLWVLPFEVVTDKEHTDAESCIERLGGKAASEEFVSLHVQGLPVESRVQVL
jgi:hypothetical protein